MHRCYFYLDIQLSRILLHSVVLLLLRELFPNYYRMYMLSVIYFCTLLTLMYGSESVFSFAEDNLTSF